MKVILMGTDKIGCRTMFEGTIQKARNFASVNDLRFWSIYRPMFKGRNFHNATDPDFLIEHNNDPFWLNIEAREGIA
jgi:hypothetical protein